MQARKKDKIYIGQRSRREERKSEWNRKRRIHGPRSKRVISQRLRLNNRYSETTPGYEGAGLVEIRVRQQIV